MPIVMQLIGRHGTKNFDSTTKTKTIETLLSHFDSESFGEFFNYLKKDFLDQSATLDKYPEDSANLIDNHRLWALNQIYALTKQKNSGPKDEEWIKEILQFFMFYGFFIPSENKKKVIFYFNSVVFVFFFR